MKKIVLSINIVLIIFLISQLVILYNNYKMSNNIEKLKQEESRLIKYIDKGEMLINNYYIIEENHQALASKKEQLNEEVTRLNKEISNTTESIRSINEKIRKATN